MTKQEILALIDAKIAGQGTNIDAGSALPEILSGILGLIPDGALTTSPQELTEGQQDQVLENLALTDVLRYSEQSLTDAQKNTALINLGIMVDVSDLVSSSWEGKTFDDFFAVMSAFYLFYAGDVYHFIGYDKGFVTQDFPVLGIWASAGSELAYEDVLKGEFLILDRDGEEFRLWSLTV